jgi:hypothetical protein
MTIYRGRSTKYLSPLIRLEDLSFKKYLCSGDFQILLRSKIDVILTSNKSIFFNFDQLYIKEY